MIMLGELSSSDPDSRLCCRPESGRHPLGKRFIPKTAELDGIMQPKATSNRGGAMVWLGVGALKVLLATGPRALLRSTLTAPTLRQESAAKNCLWITVLRQSPLKAAHKNEQNMN